MAERRENSVLFSLRELRQIEDDRVKQEVEDVKKAEEDERQKVIAAEQAKRDAQEKIRRDAEEAERMRLQQEELRLREEQLRLEEVERRHRVEAQAKLEEQRLKLEIEAKSELAKKRKPWGLISASIVLVLVVAGLGIYAYTANEQHKKVEAQANLDKAEAQRQLADLQKKMDDQIAAMAVTDAENKKLVDQLTATQDAAQQSRLREEIAHNQAVKQKQAEDLEALRQQEFKRRTAPVNVKCKDKNDPLCGM